MMLWADMTNTQQKLAYPKCQELIITTTCIENDYYPQFLAFLTYDS